MYCVPHSFKSVRGKGHTYFFMLKLCVKARSQYHFSPLLAWVCILHDDRCGSKVLVCTILHASMPVTRSQGHRLRLFHV